MESNFPINIDIEKQPTDCTCGPTCLHAVYRYFESDVVLDSVIEGVRALEDGGTLGVFLGLNALSRNYSAQIYSYNLSTFDPSWGGLTSEELIQKLREQAKHKAAKKFQLKSKAYIEFLSRGGKLSFQQLSVELLQRYFSCGIPILTGLSATYLYGSKREYTDKNL
ncbi:MAG: hypothetical protein KDD60_07025, partial [Bdellovibrionales bacterium]|nr:hypothetical protein [Bdellovibrionales bacterium]